MFDITLENIGSRKNCMRYDTVIIFEKSNIDAILYGENQCKKIGSLRFKWCKICKNNAYDHTCFVLLHYHLPCPSRDV